MAYGNNEDKSLANILNEERRKADNPLLDRVQSGIYQAIIVDPTKVAPERGDAFGDPEGRGRVPAYVPGLGQTPREYRWFQYASPFGGSNGSSSYGFFSAPPDANTTILVFYAENGDLREGYWFAVANKTPNTTSGGGAGAPTPDPETGIGEGAFETVPVSVEGRATAQDRQTGDTMVDDGLRGPSNSEISEQGVNSERNINLANAGVISDPVRGPSTSHPNREATMEVPQQPRVYGWVSPGQNGITMDDGNTGDDGTVYPSQIRIQTGSGAAVILDGSNDMIYVMNSTGSGFIEIGPGGDITMFTEGSMHIRSEKDLSIRADQNIYLDAGEKVNIKSGNNTHIQSGNQVHVKSGGSQFFDSGGSNHTKVSGNMYASTGGLMHLNGPQAAMAQEIPVQAQPDIQNLESTEARDIAGPAMPSHEPYMRPSPPSVGGAAGQVIPDPNSYAPPLVNYDMSQLNVDQTGTGEGSVTYVSGFQNATRNKPIQSALLNIIRSAAQSTSLDVVIFSGGQDPIGTPNARRTGSVRHDNGWAADIWIYNEGRQLSANRQSDVPLMQSFTAKLKQAGATGIGIGTSYMGGVGIHVDISYGRNPGVPNSSYWGNGHTGAGAVAWLPAIMGSPTVA